MSTTEILAELPKLSFEELEQVHQRIIELEEEREIVPSAEMLAAIDAGRESLKNEPTVTVNEARQKIAQWAGKSV